MCVAREDCVLNETRTPSVGSRSPNERIKGLQCRYWVRGSRVQGVEWLEGGNISFASKGSGRTSHRRCMSRVLEDEQDLTRQKNEGKAF